MERESVCGCVLSRMISNLNKSWVPISCVLCSQKYQQPQSIYPIKLTRFVSKPVMVFRHFPIAPYAGIFPEKSTVLRFRPLSHGQKTNVLTTHPRVHIFIHTHKYTRLENVWSLQETNVIFYFVVIVRTSGVKDLFSVRVSFVLKRKRIPSSLVCHLILLHLNLQS